MPRNDYPNRNFETRSSERRTMSWQPPSILPEPAPHPDYVYRWIRKSTYGELDPSNVSKKQREGWEPVRSEEHPDLKTSIDVSSRDSGLVEIGGLILCRMPREIAVARKEYYEEQAAAQLRAVNTNQVFHSYAQPSAVMPLAPNENRTETTVGGRASFGR